MDIAAMSISMNQGKVQQAASLAVMKMVMNNQSQNANEIMKMMGNMAVDENLGNAIDVMA